ncbi:MAG TPA: hypothetical protein VKU44_02075 [Terriglobia bacterium]|nr:hypothetical protein [Terriglobia bacterium]
MGGTTGAAGSQGVFSMRSMRSTRVRPPVDAIQEFKIRFYF